MIVYRFQDVDGRGPYKPGMRDRWGDADHDFRGLRSFIEDPDIGVSVIRGRRPGRVGCAFLSLEQARRWFTPREVMRMQRCGYELICMDATVLAASDQQCVIEADRPLCEIGFIVPAEEIWPILTIATSAG